LLNRNFFAFLDVNPCLKFARRVFRSFFAWSFSMLSSLPFLNVSDQAKTLLFSIVLQGATIRD